jgi:hypothetical protein
MQFSGVRKCNGQLDVKIKVSKKRLLMITYTLDSTGEKNSVQSAAGPPSLTEVSAAGLNPPHPSRFHILVFRIGSVGPGCSQSQDAQG